MDRIKQELDSLAPATPLSGSMDRRDFIKTTLGTGFAAA